MPKIDVSEEVYDRILAFLPVGEYLAEENLSLDLCGEALIQLGLNAFLAFLLHPQRRNTFLHMMQQFAARCPEEVFSFLEELLDAGNEADRERLRQEVQLTFQPPRPRN